MMFFFFQSQLFFLITCPNICKVFYLGKLFSIYYQPAFTVTEHLPCARDYHLLLYYTQKHHTVDPMDSFHIIFIFSTP